MPLLFWIDIIGLCFSIIITGMLTLLVVGVEPKNQVNRSFGFFTGTITVWEGAALLLRLSLWLEPVLPTGQFFPNSYMWMKSASVLVPLMSIFSLLFATTYLDRRTRRTDLAIAFGLLVLILLLIRSLVDPGATIPEVKIDANGLIIRRMNPSGMVALGVFSLYILRSIVLFVRERHRPETIYLALSLIILLLGLLLRSAVYAPFPILSFSNTLSALMLAYAIISKQIFNPLKAQTVQLNREIDERKEAEDAFQKSEIKYRLIAENTADLISILDMNLRFTYISPASKRIRGFTVEEAMEQTLEQVLTPESMRIALSVFEEEMLLEDSGKANPDRTRILELEEYKKDGSTVWLEVNLSFLRDKDFNPVEILIVSRDITDRKRAEEQLLQSETNYRILSENPNSIVMRFDSEGNILFVNKYASDLFGYKIEEMIGNKSTDLIHPKNKLDGAKAKEFFSDLLENPDKYRTNENENITKDGESLWISWTNTPTYEEDGTFSGLISTGFDITERKRAEEEKAKLESYLIQAQKMEAIGTLAGGIAHDFNNILFPMIGYSEMLREDLPADSPLQGHVNGIIQAALRSKNLVKQILTFSRQGDQDLSAVKLQPIVKEAFNLLRSSIPTTINIQQDIDSDCGIVMADPTKIHQVIMNLATNAYHAMEEAGGSLKVNLRQVQLESDQSFSTEMIPGEYALLSISDTGIGIEKNIMGKMFDPYFTTKKTGKGTGLGLSVVKGIVKSCNGNIHIHSEPGKGTEVQVHLPIMDRKVDEIRTDRSEPIQGGIENILLVDDEEAIIKMEQQMLERLGYKATIRTGSIEALEAFKANPDSFDLIITDMTMPNMTGIQLAGEIKKIRSDIPIIMCTGFSYQIDAEKSKALGIHGFVMKPVVMKEIADTIRKVMDNKH